MKKINKKQFEQFCRIEKIVNHAIHTISQKKVGDDEFEKFISDEKNREELMLRFSNKEKIARTFERVSNQDMSSDVERLLTDICRLKPKKKNSRLFLYQSVAAAAALIAITFLVWTQKTDNLPSVANSVTKPTLILDNGATILLDEVHEIEQLPVSKVTDSKIVYNRNDSAVNVYNTLIVPSKYTYSVILEDSTEVIINAGSTLKYPVKFNGDSREVELNGEAYFKVKKRTIPFIVRMKDCTTKVYGTEFNVNSYNQMENIEVLLVSGKIGFKYGSNDEVILQPNQKIEYNKVSGQQNVSIVDASSDLGWISGLFQYHETKLEHVLQDIQRWYGVKINYGNTDQIEISITLDRESTIDETILFLGKIINRTIVKEGKEEYTIK